MSKAGSGSQGEQSIAFASIDELHRRYGLEGGVADLSVSEVVETFLGRIDRLDQDLQSYSVLWPERARAAAKKLDADRREGEPVGALHGVPVALKDLCDVAGEPTRAGTTALGDRPATENAEVVDRLERAGAVILGKVKMTEGAFIAHHPSVTPPLNPWNRDRWTGISSSGSGVSVSAGLATLALGTDTGGSIRYPSSACGLAGLKPTHGRVSLRGVFPLSDSLDHIGPMGRSVSDVARGFSPLCGFDARDAWSRAHNPEMAAPSALSARVRGLTIGYDPRYGEEGVDSEIVTALHAAMDHYRELGAEVVEVSLPEMDEALGAWVFLGSAEIATAHAETYRTKKDEYGPELAQSIELGLRVSGIDVARAWKTRTAFARRLAGYFEAGSQTCPSAAPSGLDAILAPVIPGLFAAGTNLADVEANPSVAIAVRYTSPFNLSGSPALTLPCGFDREGAPIGHQLIGPDLSEARLLALGSAYQSATDWHLRHPDI